MIRAINVSDAPKFLTLRRQLAKETTFMLHEPEEIGEDPVVEEKKIQQIIDDPHKAIFVLANDHELVGYVAVFGDSLSRIKHRASLVIGILEAYTGKGYGKKLLQEAEKWAKDHGISRLELTVMTTNKRGLWLYGTAGFHVEGIRRKALIVRGRPVDEFYMAKLI